VWSNYVLQRTPGTFLVSSELRGPAPLNTALALMLALVLLAMTIAADPMHMKILSAERGPIGLETALRQDVEVIQSLRDSGSDLAKPHPIDFYFYFSTKAQAESAAADVRDAGLEIIKIEPGEKHNWFVLALKNVVPTVPNVQELTRELTEIAERHSGSYDGWEAPIVR
jgi:hypothetical protein